MIAILVLVTADRLRNNSITTTPNWSQHLCAQNQRCLVCYHMDRSACYCQQKTRLRIYLRGKLVVRWTRGNYLLYKMGPFGCGIKRMGCHNKSSERKLFKWKKICSVNVWSWFVLLFVDIFSIHEFLVIVFC
jgi:hypothetical protein